MRKPLKIKVCGNKFPGNIKEVSSLRTEMMGFIFYEPSSRHVEDIVLSHDISKRTAKVGVFVNETISTILSRAMEFDLEYVQLHGDESVDYCQELKVKSELKIIKVFRVGENFDFHVVAPFEKVAIYFLFDTKTEKYGGSGKKFNWEILNKYQGHTPFFLSGGIGPVDIGMISKLSHPMLIGLDLNSGFEDAPGIKNIEKLKEFIKELNQ